MCKPKYITQKEVSLQISDHPKAILIVMLSKLSYKFEKSMLYIAETALKAAGRQCNNNTPTETGPCESCKDSLLLC